jgi:hypothetical protein
MSSMSSPAAPRGWLRPRYARAVLVAGLLVSLVPLSRRAAKAQSIRFELPARFRQAAGRLSVSWTRDGDTEALGGFTLTLPAGTPASLLRDISAPSGIYRVDISLERVNEVGDPGRESGAPMRPAREVRPEPAERIEITRQLSLDGTQVRVILEDTPREPARLH